MPSWLMGSINKDAVTTGKQEMTAAGRAFISYWLVSEVFDKFFHPDLEPTLSSQLKSIHTNIRRFAPLPQTPEEEDYLTAKVVNWRLSTLEGLSETLRAPSCATNRANLTDKLKEGLVAAVSNHLHEPAPPDLEGGVHMIIELVVSMAIHLPLESRDVQIEYFPPGHSIMQEHMKMETGIPPLTYSAADDAAERLSMRSAHSDITDTADSTTTHDKASSKGRSMLSAITGQSRSKDAKSGERKQAGATGSSSSLNMQRPESSQGMKDKHAAGEDGGRHRRSSSREECASKGTGIWDDLRSDGQRLAIYLRQLAAMTAVSAAVWEQPINSPSCFPRSTPSPGRITPRTCAGASERRAGILFYIYHLFKHTPFDTLLGDDDDGYFHGDGACARGSRVETVMVHICCSRI